MNTGLLTLSIDNRNMSLIQNHVIKHIFIHIHESKLKCSAYGIYYSLFPCICIPSSSKGLIKDGLKASQGRANMGSGVVSLWLSGTSTPTNQRSVRPRTDQALANRIPSSFRSLFIVLTFAQLKNNQTNLHS